MSETFGKVVLTIQGLKRDIEAGLTRDQLALKYKLPRTQINKAIADAGLKNKRAAAKSFVLLNEDELPTAPTPITLANTADPAVAEATEVAKS